MFPLLSVGSLFLLRMDELADMPDRMDFWDFRLLRGIEARRLLLELLMLRASSLGGTGGGMDNAEAEAGTAAAGGGGEAASERWASLTPANLWRASMIMIIQ